MLGEAALEREEVGMPKLYQTIGKGATDGSGVAKRLLDEGG